jgi:nitroreductase
LSEVDTDKAAQSFFELVTHQRACRSFRQQEVDDALVARVLEAATVAPSAENRQPWVFVVVRDRAKKAAIGELTAKAWAGGGRSYSEARLERSFFEDVDRGARGSVAEAPVLIVVGGDTTDVETSVLDASVFPAVQNLLLAAAALGLGSALTTLTLVFGAELSEIVGFPSEVRPLAVVPLGFPQRALGPPRRRPFGQTTYRDRFGVPW